MRMIVTGAGGFLGAAVTIAASRAGHHVVAVARRADPERLRGLDAVPLQVLDVADTPALERAIADERPDVIVHCAWAGLTGGERDDRGQVDQLESFCRLIDAAARGGVRKVVGIGSQAEYGVMTARTDEDAPTRPTSLYGATKLAAGVVGERLAANAGMAFAWLRVFAVYGPGDNGHWLIPGVLAALSRGEAPRLTAGTQRVDYLFIDDAAAAVLAVTTTPEAVGTFNLASGQSVTVREIIEELRDRAAPQMALRFGEVPFSPNQTMHIEGAPDRLCRVTGWRPRTSLQTGLAATITAAMP